MRQNPLVVRNIFPPNFQKELTGLTENIAGIFSGFPQAFEHPVPLQTPLIDDHLFLQNDSRSIQARLTAPFLDLYHNHEIPARNEARSVTKEQILNLESGTSINRLQCGYTIEQLYQRVNHLGYEAFDILSFFLDQAIDRGVVVPITAEREGHVFRAYRHGEDVLFCESQIYLFQLALKEFVVSSGRTDGIPRIWIEKILVILIRILVQRKLVSPVYRQLDLQPTVGVRYSLHGAVVRIGSEKLYGFDDRSSLIDNLQERGLIRKDEKGLYVLDEIDGVANKDAEHVAITIGQVFGKLAKQNMESVTRDEQFAALPNKDLILIATCLNEVDVAAALAAELDIVFRGWQAFSKILLTLDKAATSKVRESRGNILFMAINNGEWKYTSVRKGLPWKAVQAARDKLGDRLLQNIWDSFWPTHDQVANPGDLNVERLVNDQGGMLIQLGIFVRMLEIAFYVKLNDTTRTDKLLKEIEHLRNEHDAFCSGPACIDLNRAVTRLSDRLAASTLDPRKMQIYANHEITKIVERIPSVLAQVDLIAFQYGKPIYVNRYEHAIYIDILSVVSGNERVFEILSEVKTEIARKASSASKSAIIAFPGDDYQTSNSGFWVLSKGEFSRRWLARLAAEVVRRLAGMTELKIVFFPNLTRDFMIYQNGLETVYRNDCFWSYAAGFLSNILPNAQSNTLLIIESEALGVSDNVISEFAGEFKEIGLVADDERLEVESTDGKKFRAIQIGIETKIMGAPKVEQLYFAEIKAKNSDGACDVGLITIVKCEIKAVVRRLKQSGDYKEWKSQETGRVYYSATVLLDEHEVRVVATQALGMGNRSVGNAFNAFRKDFRTNKIVLLGIAGSLQKDVKLCDVVIADRVIFYESRAETALGPKRRGDFARTPADILVQVNAFLIDNDTMPAVDGSFNGKFSVHLGPIASGEAVVKYRDADVIKWIDLVNEKTSCIEMEAAGFSQAVDEATLEESFNGTQCFIARGISDHADEEKDDKWQGPAVANAMSVVLQMCAGWR